MWVSNVKLLVEGRTGMARPGRGRSECCCPAKGWPMSGTRHGASLVSLVTHLVVVVVETSVRAASADQRMGSSFGDGEGCERRRLRDAEREVGRDRQ